MKHKLTLSVLVALLWLGLTGLAGANGSGDYTLIRWTVDGGGITLGGGDGYVLGATVGQPDAGVLADGDYTLTGGFWVGGAHQRRIYLPLVLKNY
jgi:hypothetical protein